MDERQEPIWRRVFPRGEYRWNMGLRRANLAEYFAPGADAEAALADRRRWLAEEPDKYSALTDDAATALQETVDLARTLQVAIDTNPAEPSGLARTNGFVLRRLGRAWEPDFVWLRLAEDRRYRMVGGVLCFPSGWALTEKLGGTMTEIHGPVPDLNAALGASIENFLARLVPGEAWRRENVGFARDGERNHHPSRPRRKMDATVRAEEVWLRLEQQLLFKLPSGDILFGIRVDTTPLVEVLQDAESAECVATALTTMSAAAAEYKGVAAARDTLIAICKKR